MRTNDFDPEYPDDIIEDFDFDSIVENSKAHILAKEASNRFLNEMTYDKLPRNKNGNLDCNPSYE